MNTGSTTRKLPVPWSEDAKSQKRGHMIPDVVTGDVSRFVNLETHKTAEVGALVFLGVAVGASDIEAKLRKKIPHFILSSEARALLGRYLASLSSLKVGNVIRLKADGSVVVIREHAISSHAPRLP